MESAINFKNSAGAKLIAILENPTGRKDAPVFILCHGHGSNKNSKTFISLKRKVGAKGISTLRIDCYGHGESDGNFEDFTATEAIDDIHSAINLLKSEDYSKIGLVGSSLGGFAGLIVAARTPEIFALAIKSPALDFSGWKDQMIKRFGKNWGINRSVFFDAGSVKSNLSEARLDAFAADVLKYDVFAEAGNIKAPVFIVHGENDQINPSDLSKKVCQIIPNCTLGIVEGADHEYTAEGTYDNMIDALANFISIVK